MKILMPFYYIDDLDFYFPLVISLTGRVREIHIAYVKGAPRDEWKRKFFFHKLNVSSFGKSKTIQFFLSRRNICQQLEKIGVDGIFALSEVWTLEFCSYCSRKLKIPFVVWFRGDHRKVREARGINWFKRLIINHLEVRYLNQAVFVIPNCLSLYKKLKEWGVEKGRITQPVYNCVDTRMFKPSKVPRSNKFTVAYAGRICPEKRIAEFLEIAKKLKDIRFIMAGSKVMNIVFPENVEYFGKLPFLEMPTFYNKADLVVLPSITEGFPSVILEAYACEKPVLVAKEAFPKELEVFGEVASLDEFGQKIRGLQNSDLKTLGKKARKYVKKRFNWNQFGEKIKNYLERVIKAY